MTKDFEQDVSRAVWNYKYRYRGEESWATTCLRVCRAIYENDKGTHHSDAFSFMRKKLWMPAGRIISGAGTDRRVTLYNCSVSPTIQDSLDTDPALPGKGIWDAFKIAATALQAGSGIGMDFSELRPRGAGVRLGSKEFASQASGPVSYMDVWSQMSATMASAGERRGAMMATLRCDHPDIEEFVTAKRTPGRLTQFNVSVLVTDAFMRAVADDSEVDLWHDVGPTDTSGRVIFRGNSSKHHIYKTIGARDLWEKITRNTHEHSEPGVIFIDRVNEMNPLSYCEDIRCTNPCGEQPLPPYGVCNLGHVNLALMVRKPYTAKASIDWDLLKRVVRCGVRFLDNVVDVTLMPAEGYSEASAAKRRIGLGVTGLANVFQQFTCRYGSKESVVLTEAIMQFIAIEAYDASADLAEERGSFPAYSMGNHMQGQFFDRVSERTKSGNGVERLCEKVRAHGLRNGVLLTVAPTGTTSLVYDNVSAGIEPDFSHREKRTIIFPEGPREVVVESWGLRSLNRAFPEDEKMDGAELPEWMDTATKLHWRDHLAVTAAAQRWVDAAISKTVNVPADIPYEEFKEVYDEAYRLECKGVTTYRPSVTRGAVRVEMMNEGVDKDQDPGDSESRGVGSVDHSAPPVGIVERRISPPIAISGKRPRVLPGKTYKVKVGDLPTMYVTVNDVTFEGGREGQWEVFINASEQENHGWATAVARLGSFILRHGFTAEAVAKELMQTFGLGGFYEGRFTASCVAAVADVLKEHAMGQPPQEDEVDRYWHDKAGGSPSTISPGKSCPNCLAFALVNKEGCLSCTACAWSNCG